MRCNGTHGLVYDSHANSNKLSFFIEFIDRLNPTLNKSNKLYGPPSLACVFVRWRHTEKRDEWVEIAATVYTN